MPKSKTKTQDRPNGVQTELHTKRLEVVKLARQGVRPSEIARRVPLSRSAVYEALKLLSLGGEAALQPSPRGRRVGVGRTLTLKQESDVRRYMSRRPRDHKLNDLLWSVTTVRQLIESKCGVSLTEAAVTRYLARWGVGGTGGRASRNARLQECDPDVRARLESNYAELERRAWDTHAQVWWVSSPVRLASDFWNQPTQIVAPSGDDDEGKNTELEKRSYIISLHNNQGKRLFVILKGTHTAKNQIRVLNAIAHDAGRAPVFLIRPSLNAYAGQDVASWINHFNDFQRERKKEEEDQPDPPPAEPGKPARRLRPKIKDDDRKRAIHLWPPLARKE